MAEAPDRFRIAPSVSWLSWEEGAPEVAGAALLGLDLESRVAPYLGFRLDGSRGRTEIVGADRSVDAIQWMAELAAVLRASFAPLERSGVVPFGVVGAGTVVHDPDADDLITRSQTAVSWGGGLEVDPGIHRNVAVRLEWRRSEVQLEEMFVPTERDATGRSANRLIGTLSWAF